MNLRASSCSDSEVLCCKSSFQRPSTPSCASSYVGSPPSTPPISPGGSAASTVSETDDGFPFTPDSKCSGNAHCIADTSGRTGSPTPSRRPKQHHVNILHSSYHPYRRTSPVQDARKFECMLANDSLENMKGNIDEGILRHMETLGPQSFPLVVHYKEAVRERQRLDLFLAYWAREESKRLDTLRLFVLRASQEKFTKADRDAAALLGRLFEKYPPPGIDPDVRSLGAFKDHTKSLLRKTDAQIDFLKDRIRHQSEMAKSLTDGSNNSLDATRNYCDDIKLAPTPIYS